MPSKSILITGDFVPHSQVERNLIAGKLDAVFGTMLPEIRQSALAITNLETTLTCGGEAIAKTGPNLRVDPALMPSLTAAGFKLFALANNHSRDWGDAAFLETLQTITNNGGKYVGGGKTIEEADTPFRTIIDGMKITVFNASMHQPCCVSRTNPGANPLRPAHLAAQIAAEKCQADFILAIIHDGKECLPFPSPRIRDNYRAFIDAGANAVIGHHPHIAQGYESYHGGFIAYSLGNFQFPARDKDNTAKFWDRGYAVRLNFTKDGFEPEILAHINNRQDDCVNLMTGSQKDDFLAELVKLNAILADDAICDQYYLAAGQKYMPYYRQRMFEDQTYFAHVLLTEEHTDVLCAVSNAENIIEPEDLAYFTRTED